MTNLYLDVELTNRCNAACLFCPRHRIERPIGDMSEDSFGRVVEAVARAHVRQVTFSGFGEPLLHQNLIRCILRLRSVFGGIIQINTNGSLLTRERSAALVASGLTVLNLSYNGPGKEAYERTMKGMSFERTRENVSDFVRARGNRSRPLLTLQASTADTRARRKQTLRIGSSLGMDLVVFYPFNNRAGNLGCDRQTTPTVPLEDRFCFRLLFVAWDGTIYPCSHDIRGMEPLGDIARDSLDAIRKRDYPMCAECTICRADDLETHPMRKSIMRNKLRRMFLRSRSPASGSR